MKNSPSYYILEGVRVLLIIFFMIFATKGLGFIGWNLIVPPLAQYLVMFILLAFFVFFSFTTHTYARINRLINLLFFLPIVAVFVKLFIGSGESFNIEIQNTFLPISAWAIFYIFWRFGIPEGTIIFSIIIVGLITFALQVYQQFNPDSALFVGNAEFEDIKDLMRNDIYRFTVGSWSVALCCMYYFWSKILSQKFSLFNIIMFIIFVSSIYMYLTRQLLIAALITFIVSFFLQKSRKSNRFGVYLIVIVFVGAVTLYFDELFGYFIELTKENDHSQNIRFEFMGELLLKTIENPIMFLLGHGGYSIIEAKWESRDFFLSDVGFIGYLWKYGLFYICVYFLILYKFAFKNDSHVPLYARLYMISTTINSAFMYPCRNQIEIFIWSFIMYAIARGYSRNTGDKRNVKFAAVVLKD